MEKYGWKYNVTGDENNLKMEIIPPDDKIKHLPETLFKIYPLNSNSIDALLNSYVYASHPSEFNDLFDCHKDLIEYDDINLIKLELSKLLKTDHEFISKIETENIIKLASIEVFHHFLYSKFGIYSMTDAIENIKLWSVYCNHESFAIEFDINKLIFNLNDNESKTHGPFHINYQNFIEKTMLSEGKSEAVLFQTNLKEDNWRYENEWRLLIESKKLQLKIPVELLKMYGGKERKFCYKLDSIKSIRLGNDFFKQEEITKLTNNEFKINLKNNKIEFKVCIINFVYENSIDLYISVPNNQLFQIEFERYRVEKINLNVFKLIKTY